MLSLAQAIVSIAIVSTAIVSIAIVSTAILSTAIVSGAGRVTQPRAGAHAYIGACLYWGMPILGHALYWGMPILGHAYMPTCLHAQE